MVFNNTDRVQFVVSVYLAGICMCVGYSGDFTMEDVAVAIQALANGTMQVLPGASFLCFAFTVPATQL